MPKIERIDPKNLEYEPTSAYVIPQEFYPEWAIKYVNPDGFDKFEVLLAGTLLPSMTQAELAERTVKARKIAEFDPTNLNHYGGVSYPLLQGTFAALRKGKEDPQAKEAIKFIYDSIRNNYINTLTRIKYNPKGMDEVIHDFNMPTQSSVKVNVVSPNRFISEKDSPVLLALLGTSDIEEINKDYQLINQTDAHLWRLNSKPKSIDERVARLGADSVGACLSCGRVPEVSLTSFGGRVRKAHRKK